MRFNGKTVWIVGASGGIGEHVAYEFAKRNTVVLLSARRLDELTRVQEKCVSLGSQAHVFPLDVTSSDQIEQVCNTILDQFEVDVLVNNAGVSQRGTFEETKIDVDRRIFEINVFGILDITKRMLPGMIKRGYGHIAVTSSVVGKFGFPLRSAYAASKHALHGYFETLYIENRDQGVKVTLVCPGRIRTDISYHAITASGSESGVMDKGQLTGMPAEECARKYVRGMEKGKREAYIGKESMLIYLRKFVPSLFYWITGRISAR